MSTHNSKLSRRDFLKVAAAGSAGILVSIYLGGCGVKETPTSVKATAIPTVPGPTLIPDVNWQPSIHVLLNNHGEVTITAFRSEMGQGIRTAIAMVIADDMDVPWEAVKLISQAPANGAFGDQLTGGSESIHQNYKTLRHAGTVVRSMLMKAAAQRWNVDAAKCSTEPGMVIHPDGQQKIAYGDLVEDASKLEALIQEELFYKPDDQFRIQGQRIGHWDAANIVTGKAVFGMDVKLPGMLYAAVARCPGPVFYGGFASYDATKALAVPGVKSVYEIGQSIAVVAENTWAAFKGRDALEIVWDESSNADMSTESLYASLTKSAPNPADAEADVFAAAYDIPFEAHETMEPMNCTAYVHDGLCEVWAPTQNPQSVQSEVASRTGITSQKVIVNVTLMGGGFGRRLQADYAVEAALASKAAGVPIKVAWTRADDIQHDYYHPMSHHYAVVKRSDPKNRYIREYNASSAIPTGAWRSVTEFTAAYPAECFIDEVANELGRDPLDLRLESYNERASAVIKLAAEKAGWGQPMPAGWGRGMAHFAIFGVTYVADVAEVEVDASGNIKVHRIVCAVDCGHVVNPDNVEAQMQSGIAFGLTAALKAKITLANGCVQQSDFSNCPIIKMNEMPKVEVYIVESDNAPSGIGEMGVPPVAPAIANAVFAATGKRIRHIPIQPEDLL